jgi:hypothetical protein
MPGHTAIIGTFDTINRVGEMPVPFSFVIADCWTSGVGHFVEYLTISDPGGTEVVRTSETNFWLPNTFHRHTVNHYLTLALETPGLHTVRVYLDHEPALDYKLKFVILPQPGSYPTSQG